MDTRGKIIGAAEAVRLAQQTRAHGKQLKVAIGFFDPLLAEHARRLDAILNSPSSVMVLVATPERPLLPARARAELVAALAAAHWVVVVENSEVDKLLDALQPDQVSDWRTEDVECASQLIQHVRSRCQLA